MNDTRKARLAILNQIINNQMINVNHFKSLIFNIACWYNVTVTVTIYCSGDFSLTSPLIRGDGSNCWCLRLLNLTYVVVLSLAEDHLAIIHTLSNLELSHSI